MKRNDGGRFLSKLKLLLHSFLIKFLSVQSQCGKSLRRFSTTSASYYFWIVKAAKVKSTSFCLVSTYLPGQNIKGLCCIKKRHRFLLKQKINNVRRLVKLVSMSTHMWTVQCFVNLTLLILPSSKVL